MAGEILYQGHGSLRLKTGNGKTIYIDPFAGTGYDDPADLILVTHQHPDHNQLNLVNKKDNCVIFQNFDALKDGKYNTLDLGDIKVEAVEAYNYMHPKDECVGYIISFDGKTIYVSGDTGKTEEMEKLGERHLDYAFLPIDGIFTMNPQEATECAELIKADHVIPYHMAPGNLFDIEKAKSFTPENRVILKDGEKIEL